MQLQAAEAAVVPELKDMTITESAGATTRKSKTTIEEMLNAIGDSLSHLGGSDDEQDVEDEEYGERLMDTAQAPYYGCGHT